MMLGFAVGEKAGTEGGGTPDFSGTSDLWGKELERRGVPQEPCLRALLFQDVSVEGRLRAEPVSTE